MEAGPNSVFKPWTAQECRRLLADKRIQDELRRRRTEQELRNLEEQAKSEVLGRPEFVKASLVDAMISETGPARVLAIRLGLVVAAVMTGKGDLVMPADPAGRALFYSPLVTTTQTQAITREKEKLALPQPELEEDEVILSCKTGRPVT